MVGFVESVCPFFVGILVIAGKFQTLNLNFIVFRPTFSFNEIFLLSFFQINQSNFSAKYSVLDVLFGRKEGRGETLMEGRKITLLVVWFKRGGRDFKTIFL